MASSFYALYTFSESAWVKMNVIALTSCAANGNTS